METRAEFFPHQSCFYASNFRAHLGSSYDRWKNIVLGAMMPEWLGGSGHYLIDFPKVE